MFTYVIAENKKFTILPVIVPVVIAFMAIALGNLRFGA